jgi:hypothetical protein
MADAAGFDAQANAAGGRIYEGTLHEIHFSRRCNLNSAITRHGSRFLSEFVSEGTRIMINEHEPSSAAIHMYMHVSTEKISGP